MPSEIALLTRSDCSLCLRARTVVERIARDYRLLPTYVDIDGSADLRRVYNDRVPVVTIDGHVVAEGRVSEFRVRRALGPPASLGQFVGLARSALLPGETDHEMRVL